MNSLKDLCFKPVYDSDNCNILTDFYIPVLSRAKTYDRAVGYFNATTLNIISNGITAFSDKDIKLRYLVGHELDIETFNALKLGYSQQEKILESMLDDWLVPEEMKALIETRFSVLINLIQKNKLDLKIAFREHGIYHEKVGIVTDNFGNIVLFQGSMNETKYGLQVGKNFESFDVCKNWLENDNQKIEYHQSKFNSLWENKSKDTLVLDIPTVVKEKIRERFFRDDKRCSIVKDEIELWKEYYKKRNDHNSDRPKIPRSINGIHFKLKDHQRKAIQLWQKNQMKGILELCTGSGKTFTAIWALVKLNEDLYNNNIPFLVIISVPYVNLAEQWEEELNRFSITPIMCYGDYNNWKNNAYHQVSGLRESKNKFLCLVVVNKTMKGNPFQNLLKIIGNNIGLLFVGDEIHNQNNEKTVKALPKNATFKMGLSATVENCENVINYYGKIVAKYSLKDAINDGNLSRYNYYPHKVLLSEEEVKEYSDLCRKIAIEKSKQAQHEHGNNQYDNSSLNALYNTRNILLGNARNKTEALRNIIKTININGKKFLFYCSPTLLNNTEGNNIEDFEVEQITQVTQLLHNNGWTSSKYTSKENKNIRKNIMDNFKNNNINALVAIRCLDEGVDIPDVDSAFFIASSTNMKQFIQRRGRVLRKFREDKIASIYDFIVIPDENTAYPEARRKILENEKIRFNEIVELAENKNEIKNSYSNLFHLNKLYNKY